MPEISNHLTDGNNEGIQRAQNINPAIMAALKAETENLTDTTSPYSDEEAIVPDGISERDAQEYIIKVLVQKNRFIRGRDKNDTDYRSNPINPRTGIDINH